MLLLFCKCRGFPQVKTQRSGKYFVQCNTQGHKGSGQSNKTVRIGLVLTPYGRKFSRKFLKLSLNDSFSELNF